MDADAKKIVLTDDLGDRLALDRPPARIVSLVPSITETIIELGAGDRLVGVTSYCIHPASAVDRIPKIGGTKGFPHERVDALEPDLIIANKEENRKHQIEKLRESYPVFVTYPRTIEDTIKMILDLGVLTGQGIRASTMASECDDILTSMDPAIAGPRLKTACMIWRDPWMAAGTDSYLSALLDRVGFANVFAPNDGRYPETTLEEIFARNPDVIFLPDEPYAFGRAEKDEVDALLDARNMPCRTLLFDGSYLTWFGARTRPGLRALYKAKAALVKG